MWDGVNVVKLFHFCFPVTADTFLVEGNKQEHQLSNLKPSTTYSVSLYATKGPLTSGTVITNLQTRMYSFYSAGLSTVSSTVSRWLALSPHSRRHLQTAVEEFVWNLNVFIVFVWVSSGSSRFIHSKKHAC